MLANSESWQHTLHNFVKTISSFSFLRNSHTIEYHPASRGLMKKTPTIQGKFVLKNIQGYHSKSDNLRTR